MVEEALTARRPRARYVVGIGPKLQVAVLTSLPTGMRDRVLRVVASSHVDRRVRQAQSAAPPGLFRLRGRGIGVARRGRRGRAVRAGRLATTRPA